MRAGGSPEVGGRIETNVVDTCGIYYLRPFTCELAKEQSWKGCFEYSRFSSLSKPPTFVPLLWPFDKLAYHANCPAGLFAENCVTSTTCFKFRLEVCERMCLNYGMALDTACEEFS